MVELHFLKGIIAGNNHNDHHEQQQQQQQQQQQREATDEEKSEGIELSLGLSLNGKFGVNPTSTTTAKNQQLKRSYSSISAIGEPPRVDPPATWPPYGGALSRTCSLPVEEDRRRKELQTLRRREAKRRRSEKRRSSTAAAVAEAEYAKTAVEGSEEGDDEEEKSLPQMASQGSSASSGVSEFESQTHATPPQSLRMNKGSGAKSPQSVQSFSEQNEERPPTANLELKQSRSVSETNGMVKNVLADIPCVSTTGDGPNGKRIDGFLYRYKKGEEVRIVCICHGNFLTPAEFIKHAGGGDVEHPLRHIVVNPSPFL